MRWDQSVSERLKSPVIQLLLLLAFSLVYRMSTFGHPTMDDDETFYFLVGHAMHNGLIPYVDLWDRKPLGLFILFYLISGISNTIVAYQVAACLSSALTSWFINRIVALYASNIAGIMAGVIYIAMLPFLWGWGGQTPIFYNLFVVFGAWLVMSAKANLSQGKADIKADLAMLSCGIAITVKQTALAESVFFGLFCASAVLRSKMPTRMAWALISRWALIGSLPTLTIAAYYWGIGHWPEFWHAMVGSNIAKRPATGATVAWRVIGLYLRLFPLICVALIGLWFYKVKNDQTGKQFLVGWMIAAWIGFFLVPNFYVHYALPLLVPLSVAAGLAFARKDLGLIFFAVLSILTIGRYDFLNFERTNKAKASVNALAKAIRQHDGGRELFIYDGPVVLYWMIDQKPPTPLALPLHLNYDLERDVSHLKTADEVAKVLARKPGVVLVSEEIRNNPANLETKGMVDRYIKEHCRLVERQLSPEMFRRDIMLVYGDCAKPANAEDLTT